MCNDLTSCVPPTGCGKSTLLRLIMRLYDVSSGSILLNGIDVREVSCAGQAGVA